MAADLPLAAVSACGPRLVEGPDSDFATGVRRVMVEGLSCRAPAAWPGLRAKAAMLVGCCHRARDVRRGFQSSHTRTGQAVLYGTRHARCRTLTDVQRALPVTSDSHHAPEHWRVGLRWMYMPTRERSMLGIPAARALRRGWPVPIRLTPGLEGGAASEAIRWSRPGTSRTAARCATLARRPVHASDVRALHVRAAGMINSRRHRAARPAFGYVYR